MFEIFSLIIGKIVPLYIFIFFGFCATRFYSVRKESISPLLIYVISPIVVFTGALTVTVTHELLILPVLVFGMCCILSFSTLLFLRTSSLSDNEKNLTAFSAGGGNTGYFGLPLILALLGVGAFDMAVFALMGFLMFENTVGYYLVAKGNHGIKKALYKVLTFPRLHALILGLALNIGNVPLGENLLAGFSDFKGAYSVLGMMLIGMGLSGVSAHHFSPSFSARLMFTKFIIWPIFAAGIILVDSVTLSLLSETSRQILFIMSIVPLAANSVAYATEQNIVPEKVAIAVFLSTLIGIITIPITLTLANMVLF